MQLLKEYFFTMKKFTFGLLCAASCLLVVAEEYPSGNDVTVAMQNAVEFYRTRLSVAGGYATEWPRDLSEGRTESSHSPTVISIQPHGTTTVGMAMLRAYQATGDPLFLQGAREAASALIWCQLSSGGWASDFDFNPEKARRYHYRRDILAGDTDPGKRSAASTIDDNKTQSAIKFLLELAHIPESKGDAGLQDSLKFALDGLLAAQFPNGAWPQQFSGPADPGLSVIEVSMPEEWPREWPNEKYTSFYTLNDNNLVHVMEILERASELTGEARYEERARRLGDFLLLAQHAEPQPGWSQQYNHEMQPVWARKFEPPALSSGESLGAIETLMELWIWTGDEKYRESLPAALAWLERSQLDDGKFARFYELKTNKPLYCIAETYELTYDDGNLPTHYGFKLDSGLKNKIDRLRADLERPREDLQRSRQGPGNPGSWSKMARSLKSKVGSALKSQKPEGYWSENDTIEAGLFVKHMNAMAAYLEATDKAGDEFRTSQ